MADILEPIILKMAELYREACFLKHVINDKDYDTFLKLFREGINKIDEDLWDSRPEMDFNLAHGCLTKVAVKAKGEPYDERLLKVKSNFHSNMNDLKRVGFLKGWTEED